MALNIKSDKADALARELARRRGVSITSAIVEALEEKLEREKRKHRAPALAEQLLAIGREYADLPSLDDRPDEEILGYDEMTGGNDR